MSSDTDDVDAAVIALLYDEDVVSRHTVGNKPRYTRRGHLRTTRKPPAIAKLIGGAITASSHTAEALAKGIARARSYMRLVGTVVSDSTHTAICLLKRKLRKASELLSPGNPIGPEEEITQEQATRLCEDGTKQLSELIKTRHRLRMSKWYERLTLNWRKTSAKAMFRYIRNDSKIPHASFPDPDNGGHLTADPKRID